MVLLKPKNNKIKYGKGLFNDAIEKLPIELHLLDNGFKKYNFCGPGTKIDKRVTYNPDGSIKILSNPINKLDNGCLYHDLIYTKYKDVPNRNKADEILKKNAKDFLDNQNLSYLDKLNGNIVYRIMDYKIKNKV